MSPKLNAYYHANNDLQLYLKTGKGFHSNDMRVVMLESGKKTLPYSLGADFGTVFKPHPKFITQAAIWYLYLEDELVYVEDEAYIPLAPTLTSTGGLSIQLTSGLSSSLRYRYIRDRPGNEDNSAIAKGYFINDLLLSYQLQSFSFIFQAQNLLNVKWREAQFYTKTKLRGENAAISDMAFTPGTPLFMKVGITYRF